MVKWKIILRDVAIVLFPPLLSGAIVAVLGLRGHLTGVEITCLSLLVGSVGFVICGALTKEDRFKHLINVALGVWLISIVNVLFFGFTVAQWFFGIIFIFLVMGLGGAISFLFVKKPK